MRIDNHLLIAGDNRTDTGDMLSRLEPGDVIKAKVLDVSPQEAVLRLSDGTVIKARTTESLDVKQGQTISLSVTSRNENSFVLETVKNASQTTAANSANLHKLLETAGVRLDNINLKLAAEFLKYGAAPSAENITEALEYMKGFDGLDAEKAVFLAVKNISTTQADKDMLSGLLDGSLKLGQLLESLHKALNGEVKEAGTGTGNQNTEAIPASPDIIPDIGSKLPQQSGDPAAEINANGINDGKASLPASEIAGTDVKSAIPSNAQNTQSALFSKTGTDTTDQKIAESNKQSGVVTVLQPDQAQVKNAGVNSYAVLNDATMDDNASPKILNQSNTDTASAFTAKSEAKETDSGPNTADIGAALRSISMKPSVGTKSSGIEAADIKQGAEYLTQEALERINKSIDRLYVNINKKLSGEELDSGSINNRLSELAKELKLLIQSSSASKSVGMQAASTLNLIEDTVRLLDMFNSNNVLYYQIPVRIDNYRSTAELYVMKRNQNKNRIDPNNSVLFLSLDTKNMGRVETIIDVKGSNISMSLRTESQAASDFARQNIKNLYSGLSECGYKLTDIKYSIIGAAATPAQQEKLLSDAIRLKHGKVDFRI